MQRTQQKAHLSADMVQRILDENQQLILAVIENQRMNDTHACSQYLSKLQRNLMMLGTIGDAQVNSAGGLCLQSAAMRVCRHAGTSVRSCTIFKTLSALHYFLRRFQRLDTLACFTLPQRWARHCIHFTRALPAFCSNAA